MDPNNSSSFATGLLLEVFPQIVSQLEYNDILSCRQVCSAWKNSVDSIFRCRRNLKWKPTFPKNRDSLSISDIEFKDHTKIYEPHHGIQFLGDMGRTSANPFPTQKVVFQALSVDKSNVLKSVHAHGFLQILQRFGSHIHSISYICNEEWSENGRTVDHLRRILQFSPNLVELRFFALSVGNGPTPHLDLGRISPFPEKLVSITVVGGVSYMIVEPLLKQFGRQLHTLELEEIAVIAGQKFFNKNGLPVLECLKIKSCPSIGKDEEQIIQIFVLIMKLPTLKALSFDGHAMTGHRTTRGGLSFAFRLCSQSLQELYMTFEPEDNEQPESEKEGSNSIKKIPILDGTFPKVHTLALEYSFRNSPILLETLKRFPALQRLYFVMGKRAKATKENVEVDLNNSDPGMFRKWFRSKLSEYLGDNFEYDIAPSEEDIANMTILVEPIWGVMPKCREISLRDPFSFRKCYWKECRLPRI